MEISFVKDFLRNRELWWLMTQREVLGRYRGSALGIAWSFLTPLMMLGVYTFVFSQVFKARWGNIGDSSPQVFAVNLFAGLIVFNLFSESASKAPGLITANPNYVKKVIFPIEVLCWVTVGSALFHAVISLGILATFKVATGQGLSAEMLWLPIVWLPFLAGSLGCTFMLAAAGVFLRDIAQAIGVVLNMIMFLSPIFFPITALPPKWQPLLGINPIAITIEETRKVVVESVSPSIAYVTIGTFLGIAFCEMAYRAFRKSKKAFSDVL